MSLCRFKFLVKAVKRFFRVHGILVGLAFLGDGLLERFFQMTDRSFHISLAPVRGIGPNVQIGTGRLQRLDLLFLGQDARQLLRTAADHHTLVGYQIPAAGDHTLYVSVLPIKGPGLVQ